MAPEWTRSPKTKNILYTDVVIPHLGMDSEETIAARERLHTLLQTLNI